MNRSTFRVLTFVTYIIFMLPEICFAKVYDIDLTKMAAFGTLDQYQIGFNPNNGISYHCTPTAVMNSLTFLTNAYDKVYSEKKLMGKQLDWEAAARFLADSNYMNTDRNSGTTNSSAINGEYKWIEEYAKETTRYEGMDSIGNPGVDWIKNGAPTASFLLNTLQKGMAVVLTIKSSELLGKTHSLTLTGIHWNNVDDNMLFGDNDTLTIETSDPWGNGSNAIAVNLDLIPGQNMKIKDGKYKDYQILAAIAAGPVPEPSTVMLMGIGALGAGFVKRRKTAAEA